MSAVPPGYVELALGDARAVCRADCEAGVRAALADGPLYAWAAARPDRRELAGRAPAYAVALPLGGGDVVVRHSRHGGALAAITRDLFLPPTRAPRELAVSRRLAAAGVRTPEVVAYVVYRAGPLFRRADVATRLVPDGRDLAAVVADWTVPRTVVAGPGEPERVASWLRPTGALLHALAAAGARHPDLNLKNVLLTPAARGDGGDGSDAFDAWVLDVDVVRLPAGAVTPRQRWDAGEANAERLARSLRKWRDRRGLPVSDLDLDFLRQFARRGPDASLAVRWVPGSAAARAT